jgi:2-(1,2-epoxy-1,2-dihydrophenyl)acetyl-CoA isomerase
MSVLTTRAGSVLTITLNRPEVLNAIDDSVHAGLRAALEEAADPAIRAVVVTGAGRGFCVGQDISEFGKGDGDIAEHLRTRYHRNVLAMRALEKPILAVVNGPAAGAGLSLALACDIRIASDAAVFVPGFIGIGLVPDAGGTWFAERILGPARAFEWLTSSRRLTAAEALQWGLVSEVVPAAELEARTAVVADGLARLPTRAVAATKLLLDRASTSTLEDQLEREAKTQSEIVATGDFAEGVAAFREKREPRFTGS